MYIYFTRQLTNNVLSIILNNACALFVNVDFVCASRRFVFGAMSGASFVGVTVACGNAPLTVSCLLSS